MSEILKTNPVALRTCIFYECRRTKNVEEAFKNFCEAIGDDVIDYVDFEYWFYRFYHGNLDFYQDRSYNPKPLILTDLPMEMLNEIVGKLDIRNRFNVRKVSRKFENVVDRFKQEFEKASIDIEKQQVRFRFDNYYVHYKKWENDCFVRCNFGKTQMYDLNIELGALSRVLTISKSSFNILRISIRHPETIDTMSKLIASLSKEVCPIFYAKTVVLLTQGKNDIIQLLPLFKPGVLEELQMYDFALGDYTLARIFELDQFKRLKTFNMWRERLPLSQFERLSHLATFTINLDHVSAEDIVILRDILSKFVTLRSGRIGLIARMNPSDIGTALGIDYDNSGRITCRHPIPNSDKSLILNIDNGSIKVTVENN